jgi:peptidoglycan/LPS O-acetylase OafA/YrhL
LVIGCHYPAFSSSLWGVPKFGWVGVELFFVLSGYLITRNLLALKGNPSSYRIFYSRRARRILPPFLLVVFSVFVLGRLFNGFWDGWALSIELLFLKSFHGSLDVLHGILSNLANHHPPSLLHQGNLPPRELGSASVYFFRAVLNPTWSLSIEEWFYISWAPLVLIFNKRAVAAAIVATAIVGFVCRWLGQVDGIVWYENYFCHLDMLAFGAALALYPSPRFSRTISDVGIVCTIALAFLLFCLRPILNMEIRDAVPFAAFGMIFIGGIACCIVDWARTNSDGTNFFSRLLRSRELVWVGRRSYTLYLVHLPCYALVQAIIRQMIPVHYEWIAAIVAVATSVALAAVSWRCMEYPLLRTPC